MQVCLGVLKNWIALLQSCPHLAKVYCQSASLWCPICSLDYLRWSGLCQMGERICEVENHQQKADAPYGDLIIYEKDDALGVCKWYAWSVITHLEHADVTLESAWHLANGWYTWSVQMMYLERAHDSLECTDATLGVYGWLNHVDDAWSVWMLFWMYGSYAWSMQMTHLECVDDIYGVCGWCAWNKQMIHLECVDDVFWVCGWYT